MRKERRWFMSHQSVQFSSVIEALEYWNKVHPHKEYCSLNSLKGEEKITFRELYEESKLHASWLREQGLKKGDRVILALPNGRSFLTGFLGTLMAGGVAVPVVTRVSFLQSITKLAETLGHIFRDAAAKYVLTTAENKKLCEETIKKSQQQTVISLVDHMPKNKQFSLDPLKILPEDIAFIQYTSGSTNLPKGVVIQHQQLVAQIQSIIHGLKSNAKDCAVSWLPLFHDMGLIGAFLHSLYVGMKLVLLSPEKFLFDPKAWLMAIAEHRATLSAGPNSAYSLCASKIKSEEIKNLDLSSWRVAFSGAEPISVTTIQKFIDRFKPYGFDSKAFVAGYGMAENCLSISFMEPGAGLKYDGIRRDEFEAHQKAVLIDPTDKKNVLTFVSVGKPVKDQEVIIVDENDTILPERHVGEIAVRGPSMMAGYYQKEYESQKTIRHGWLYTGDLGYFAKGELYIVGRKKEMIIKGGRNYCPYDIERAAEMVSGVRAGNVVAFGVFDEGLGTEKVLILAEVKPEAYKNRKEISAQILKSVMQAVGIAPDEVIIYPKGFLTKTTSGKLQRTKYRELYLTGKLKNKISLKDRFRYFLFRVNLLISMFFYFISSKIRGKNS